LVLTENPDILAGLSKQTPRPRLLIGFAAETENVLLYGAEKRLRKGCDWIVANDVTSGVFGSERNAVHLITAQGAESWPELTKDEVAAQLVLRIAKKLETAA
jgi:phosphopantothenoylcysteine decarboxylase/phosphopantothenate--cysteine ligase